MLLLVFFNIDMEKAMSDRKWIRYSNRLKKKKQKYVYILTENCRIGEPVIVGVFSNYKDAIKASEYGGWGWRETRLTQQESLYVSYEQLGIDNPYSGEINFTITRIQVGKIINYDLVTLGDPDTSKVDTVVVPRWMSTI